MKMIAKRKSGRKAKCAIRLWLTTWGHGENAKLGILLTDDSIFPKILGFIDGDGSAARHAAERIIMGAPIEEEATDLRNGPGVGFYCELSGNLMLPVRPFSDDYFDESDLNFAAARYTPADGYHGAARFSVLTRDGLESLMMHTPIMRNGPALMQAMRGLKEPGKP